MALSTACVTHQWKFSPFGVESSTPLETCIPVDVKSSLEFLTLESTLKMSQPEQVVSGEWSEGLLISLRCPIPTYLLRWKLFLRVAMWLVSDASKKHGKGAYAWVISLESEILF